MILLSLNFFFYFYLHFLLIFSNAEELRVPRALNYRIEGLAATSKKKKTHNRKEHQTPTHVLILGDSVDRHIVEDWCLLSSKGPKSIVPYESVFNDGSLRYQQSHVSMNLCSNQKGDSLAFVHHFGSHPWGPYHSIGNVNNRSDPLISTKPRLERAIQLYMSKVGRPTRIFYNSELWDAVGVYTHAMSVGNDNITIPTHPSYQENLRTFEMRLHERIDGILETVALYDVSMGSNTTVPVSLPPVEVALHTTCWVVKHADRVRDYNDIIRRVSISRNLTLYDFDRDCWGTMKDHPPNSGYFILRDFIHPRTYFTGPAGEKMLCNVYSSYFYYRGNQSGTLAKLAMFRASFSIKHNVHLDLTTVMKVSLLRIRGMNETRQEYNRMNGISAPWSLEKVLPDEAGKNTFFTAVLDGKRYRWPNATLDFMHDYALLLGDIYYITQEEMNDIPLRQEKAPKYDTAHPEKGTNSNCPNDWDIDGAVNNTKGPLGHGMTAFQITHGPLYCLYRTSPTDVSWKGGIIKRPISMETLGFLQSIFHITLHTGIRDYDIKALGSKHALPYIYYEGALMQNETGNQIYLYKNGTRHLVPQHVPNVTGATSSIQYHWSDIPVVAYSADIELIPLGLPLPV